MHKNLKRALAVSAVAPLAILGCAGSASAIAGNDFYIGSDNIHTTMLCVHPSFPEDGVPDPGDAVEWGDTLPIESLRFRIEVTTSIEDGDNGGDVKFFRFLAVDNDQNQNYFEQRAKMQKLEYRYLDGDDENDDVISSHTVGTSVRDGGLEQGRDVNDVDRIWVKATWTETGPNDGSRYVTCDVELD